MTKIKTKVQNFKFTRRRLELKLNSQLKTLPYTNIRLTTTTTTTTIIIIIIVVVVVVVVRKIILWQQDLTEQSKQAHIRSKSQSSAATRYIWSATSIMSRLKDDSNIALHQLSAIHWHYCSLTQLGPICCNFWNRVMLQLASSARTAGTYDHMTMKSRQDTTAYTETRPHHQTNMKKNCRKLFTLNVLITTDKTSVDISVYDLNTKLTK